jgi:hypothetical protein
MSLCRIIWTLDSMKSLLSILLLSFACIFCGRAAEGQSSDKNEKPAGITYVKPFSFVLYPTNASPRVIRLAKEMSAAYGLREPAASADNPMCCVWLEVKPSHSKSGESYFAAEVRESGETWIYASSEDLLEKAVNRLQESAHGEPGNMVVPAGKFSYYGK